MRMEFLESRVLRATDLAPHLHVDPQYYFTGGLAHSGFLIDCTVTNHGSNTSDGVGVTLWLTPDTVLGNAGDYSLLLGGDEVGLMYPAGSTVDLGAELNRVEIANNIPAGRYYFAVEMDSDEKV